MEKIYFGFKGLAGNDENSVDFIALQPQTLKAFFGTKSFETSWQFIETLA